MDLGTALAPLATLRRFVNYTIEADPDRPGKTIKRPVDVKTGLWCNSNLPAHQYTFAEANATGRAVGFVFVEDDGYFFADIDGALEANPAGGYQWSALSHEICARFPGAAVEVSQSGMGLHIIGRGKAPPHSCKNIPLHIELYTDQRFCALTGKDLTGDASIDHTAALTAYCEQYFPPNPHGDIAGWTAEPVPEWGGPTDDADLLRAALASGKKNAANVFGEGDVTFADLWDCNTEKLAAKWPSNKADFSHSRADGALAGHLAYWTGKNHERIRDLMFQSALVHDRWTDRPEWLDMTIMRAASVVTNVAKKREAPAVPGAMALASPAATAVGAGTSLNTRSALDGVVFDGDQPSALPKQLIKGLLPCDGVAFMGGQSGAGKTFLAIDLAVAVAMNGAVEFFGHRLKERVGVVIFAAEGRGTLAHRLQVAKENRGGVDQLPIVRVEQDFNLADQGDVQLFIETLAAIAEQLRIVFGVRLGLIIIDTMAAAFGLVDENSNAEASATIRALRRIGAATGALIMPIHHYGKTEDTGLRGASGFRAGADVVLSVLAKRNETTGVVSDRRIALAKSRTHEEGPISGFDLVKVNIGFDEDGEAFGSCVVAPNAKSNSSDIGKREPSSHADFHRAYDAALRNHGIELPPVDGQAARLMVKTIAVKEEFARRRRVPDGDPARQRDAARKAFANALLSLGSKYSRREDEHGVEWMQRLE